MGVTIFPTPNEVALRGDAFSALFLCCMSTSTVLEEQELITSDVFQFKVIEIGCFSVSEGYSLTAF